MRSPLCLLAGFCLIVGAACSDITVPPYPEPDEDDDDGRDPDQPALTWDGERHPPPAGIIFTV
jgi:hypothetical protein